MAPPERLIRAGASGNAWRVEPARRAALLVDGDAYFRAVHHALLQARQQILILGWDIDTRVCLRRDLDEEGRRRATLGALLHEVVAPRGGPECYVLSWDFALIYALEREPLTALKLRFPARRRLHVELDDMHPIGASHHQKVLVVDDAIAFCGGLDLCGARWDTPAHNADEPRRHDPPLKPHPPFHDVQLAVLGPVAAALGDLARERWFRSTGHRPRAPAGRDDGGRGLWPGDVRPDVTDVPVAIARTEPAFNGRAEVREVERLHLDGIAAARRHIYVENQYLTSQAIGAALARRLAEAQGPDVVLVQPRECSGWLEASTMGVLRRRLIHDLRHADRHGRLRLYHPTLTHGAERLNVHSKVTIIDDALLRVGSANLSNRSMGLDTECDLAWEAPSADHPVAAAIAQARARLLAEHLGVSPAAVDAATRSLGLVGAVEHLRGDDAGHGRRTLAPLDVDAVPWFETLVTASAIIDPDGVIPADPTVNRELPAPTPGQRVLRAAVAVAGVVLMVLGPLLWRLPRLAEELHAAALLPTALLPTWGALEARLHSPWGVALGVGVYVVGGLVAAPLVVLHVLAALLFGPAWAVSVALTGGTLSAVTTWSVGRLLGAARVRPVVGEDQLGVTRSLRARGVLAIAAFRLRPLGPFFTVNLAAGAARLPLRPYLLGTLVGIAPGVLAVAVLTRAFNAALWAPSPGAVTTALCELGVVALLTGSLARWVHRRQQGAPPLSPPLSPPAPAAAQAQPA